jgi:tetratricopeptide (TPR) repeat protein
MVADVAGRYRLERAIGEGGMARVWLARQIGDVGFEKLVVLKTVLPHLARTKRFDAMFRDETRIAADLRHPNVVQLLDAGLYSDGHFMALELLEGVDGAQLLRSFRSRHEPLSSEIALPILIDAAHGLAYVHDKRDLDGRALGIVHRDISPSNLFVTLAGVTKVLDFGVAHARNQLTITEAGVLKGKSPYMSPEQIMGDPIDHRSDQFALAIVAAEFFTGRRLFEREGDVETLRAILDGDPSIPAQLAACTAAPVVEVIVRALSFDRERRYPTSAAFASALEEAGRQVGLMMGRGALRDAVARALHEVEVDDAPRTLVTPTPVPAPRLRDIDGTVNERAAAPAPMPSARADPGWARARAAELEMPLRAIVLRAVAPRDAMTEDERALCADAAHIARVLIGERDDGSRALLLAVASEIADFNDDAELLEDAIARAQDPEPALLMRALELAGDRMKEAGRAEDARTRYEAARVLAATDPAFASLLERNLADLALDSGDLVQAEASARRACALARAASSRFSLARAVFSLARVVLRRGQLDGAELLLDQAARALEHERDERFLGRVMFERALVCEARGDAGLAESLLRTALVTHEAHKDVVFARRARENLSALDALRQLFGSA